MKRRMLSLLLCLCLLVGVLPAQVSAVYTLTEVYEKDTVYKGLTRDVDTEELIPFDYEVPEGGAAVLIFYKTSCGNCQYTFSTLNDQSWVHDEQINIYAIESTDHTCADIRTFQTEQTPDIADQIVWYDENSTYRCGDYLDCAGLYSGSWIWPAVMICTEEDGVRCIRYADTGVTDVRRIGNSLELLLGRDLGVPKPVPLTLPVEENYDMAGDAMALLNSYREEQGLAPFETNRALTRIAMQRAAELAIFPTDTRPDATSSYDLIREQMPQVTDAFAAIAFVVDSPAQFLQELLADNWNRYNMELPDYTQMGIGCIYTDGALYWSLYLADDSAADEPADQTGTAAKTVTVNTYLSCVPDLGLSTTELPIYPGEESTLGLYSATLPLIPSSYTETVTDDESGAVIATAAMDPDGTLRITALAEGTGTLSVLAYEGQPGPFTARITVDDLPEYRHWPLHVQSDGGGQILLSQDTAMVDDYVILTVVPDPGHTLVNLFVQDSQGNDVACYLLEENEYILYMPAAEVCITAAFLPDEIASVRYALLDDVLGQGYISFLSGSTSCATVPVTFRAEPLSGMVPKSVSVTDEAGQVLELTDNGDGSYTFIMPSSSATVHAVFAPPEGYPIDLSWFDGTGGAVSSSHDYADPGQQITVVFTPDEGYEITYFYINLPEIQYTWVDDNTLHFTMPDGNVMIDVMFQPIPITSGTFAQDLTWDLKEGTLTISGQGSMINGETFPEKPWSIYQDEIRHVVIASGVTDISWLAFAHCPVLTTVTVAETVEKIDSWAFLDCPSLTTVYLSAVPREGIDSSAFEDTVADVIVPAGDRSWTDEITLDYGGTLTWNHSYSSTVVESTCTEEGYTLWQCICGDSERCCETVALGHSYENGFCRLCGTADPATSLKAFEYSVDAEAQTVTLTRYLGTETIVVVPDSYLIDGIPCTPILNSETVFSGNTSITSVTLRSGVRFADSTMYRLFAGCSSLTTVDMTGVDTSYVTSLRELFSLCYKLTNVYGYETWDTGNVESMFKTFDRVQGMPVIDLRGWDLSNLKNSGWCFQLCYAEQILLPDNLAIISSGFLNHATKVTGSTFTIPAGVKKIGYGHTIYDFATDDFVEFIVAEGNTNYKAEDGILYSMDGTEMLAIPRNKPFEDGVYEIPEGVTFLGELSFSRNYNIQKVILPDSFVIDFVPIGDDRYIVFEDRGNLNIGTNLTIAIYCYTGITDYEVKETNPNYTSVDGILYSKNMSSVIAIPTRYGRLIQIPEGVTTWSKQAMWDDREVDDLFADHVVDNLLGTCGGVCLPSTLVWMDDEQFEMINRLKVKFGDGYVITVADDNPVFYVNNDGFLTQRSVESGGNPFTDVTETDYFFDPVLWAVGRGITAGTSADTFTPGAACTRAQVVTFLWRAFGKPEPVSTENRFTDVAEGDYFYKAVLWAVENGITSGTGNGCFSPNSPCTRNQVVTFLWRAVGRPAPESTDNPFTDVPEGIYYYEPVLWAIEKGITSGTGGASFSPDAPCTRGQVVTFLYRTFSHP